MAGGWLVWVDGGNTTPWIALVLAAGVCIAAKIRTPPSDAQVDFVRCLQAVQPFLEEENFYFGRSTPFRALTFCRASLSQPTSLQVQSWRLCMSCARIPLQLGPLSEPEISNFGLYSADRNLILSVTCHVGGTLADLLTFHDYRTLLPAGTDSLECRFFQCNEVGASDFGICIDHGTQFADLNGYWIISSHSYDMQRQLGAAGVPQPSAPPEDLFDSGPIYPMHAQVAHNPHQAFEHEPHHVGPSAPPLDEHYDDAAALAPPPVIRALSHNLAPAAAPSIPSDRLLDHQVQSSIRCPITLEPFCDPVIASDGHTYERSAIMQLFSLEPSARVSPLTREPFANFCLIPNRSMRSLVQDAGHIPPDHAEIESADISLGSFNNYVDLSHNDLNEPLLRRDPFQRSDVPQGMGLAHQLDAVALPPRLREKTSALCCNYAFLIFILCVLSCVFNSSLSTQLQSLKYFQAWRTIFDSQLPLCLYLSIAISTGSVFAIMASCPLYYIPRLVCENEHLRTCFVLLIALLVPLAAVSNFNLPVPVFMSEHILIASAFAYVLWNVAIAAASSITCLSWSRNALHSWNIAQPEGLDAQMPAFPFTSLKARILAALLLALIFGFFILCFFLSFQLGQWFSFMATGLCLFVFIFILLYHCIRTFQMCKNLALAYPWFLHSLAVTVAMFVFETIWLGQALLVYPLPVDGPWQTFISLSAFPDGTSQRLWFASGLGVLDAICVIAGNSILITANHGGFRADVGTAAKKNHGKWWLALLTSMLAVPFIIASSIMPLCLQTDMVDILPNYLSWTVVVTKIIQCCVPAVVWALAPNCRIEHAS